MADQRFVGHLVAGAGVKGFSLEVKLLWRNSFAVPVFLTFLNTRISKGTYNHGFTPGIIRPHASDDS